MMRKSREERHQTLKTYIKRKIKMLEEEFLIDLTRSEIEYIKSLKSEIEVDQYAHRLIVEKL